MEIKELPFYYKSHIKRGNGGYPQILPFHLFYDKELKMFRQKSTPELEIVLNKVYKDGSLVDGSISSESGAVYVPRLLKYLLSNFDFQENSRVLEVGCGNGILLKELNKIGIKNLVGIEPGNHLKVNGIDDIEIIYDFFPSNKITTKFNLIFSFLVLEHIEQPSSFIESILEKLEDEGKLIIGVPNCEPFLKEGDVSIFIHEHFNYFNKQSLVNLMKKANLFVEDICIIEGMLLLTATRYDNKKMEINVEGISKINFLEKINKNLTSIGKLFEKYDESDIAIYVPGRALNSLFLMNRKNVRLVDDNSEVKNKYLPYLSNSIESFEQIIENPPKVILISSRTFGKQIKIKCKNHIALNDTEVYTIDEYD